MALASLALTAVSTGIGVFGAAQQAKAEADMSEYNADAAEENAAALRADASAKLALKREQDKRALAAQRATAASANLEYAGSALAVGGESARLFETDNQNSAYAAQTAERNARDEANLLRARAANARTQGWLTGAGTLLSGASTFATNYTNFEEKGLVGSKKTKGENDALSKS